MIHKHIVPALGSVVLSELEPQHIQQYYADQLGKVGGMVKVGYQQEVFSIIIG